MVNLIRWQLGWGFDRERERERSKLTWSTIGVRDGLVLARQITNLASCRHSHITRNDLAALVRIQMRQSAIAVSAAWDGLVVNMVGEGTSGALEATEVDVDNNASAVAVGSELDLSGHGAVAEVCNITVVVFSLSAYL